MAQEHNKSKVGIVLISTGIAGTERRMANLFCALSKKDPERYHLLVNEDLFGYLNRAGYQLDRYPNIHRLHGKSFLDFKRHAFSSILVNIGRALSLIKYRNQIARITKRENIRVLQVVLNSVYIFALFPIPGTAKIASLVSHLPRYYDENTFIRRLLRFSLRRYSLVDCLSPYMYEGVLRNGIEPNKVFVTQSSFVNIERYRPAEQKKKAFVFAARIFKFKNPELFLEAIGKVIARVPDAKCYLLGSGPHSAHIQKRLDELGLGGTVYHGFVWDTSVILNESLVSVSLEGDDNYPNQTVLESMASGNAMIATDVGLTRRMVDESNGVLIPPSADALADALIQMLENPKQTLVMGVRGREKILQEHRLETYVEYMTNLYDRAGKLNRFSRASEKRE